MSLIKLFLGGNNLVFTRPERVWSVTSRLGTGKWLTLFYSAASGLYLYTIQSWRNMYPCAQKLQSPRDRDDIPLFLEGKKKFETGLDGI
jgi:hypothetical protein